MDATADPLVEAARAILRPLVLQPLDSTASRLLIRATARMIADAAATKGAEGAVEPLALFAARKVDEIASDGLVNFAIDGQSAARTVGDSVSAIKQRLQAAIDALVGVPTE